MNKKAVKYNRTSIVLDVILLRTLMYIHLSEYILLQHQLSEHDVKIAELERALTATRRTGVGIGCMKLEAGVGLPVALSSLVLTRDDVGDDYNNLLTAPLLGEGYSKFHSDNQTIVLRIPQALRSLYEEGKQTVPAEVSAHGAIVTTHVDIIAIITTEVDMKRATPLCTWNKEATPIEQMPYDAMIIRNPDVNYTGLIPMIRTETEVGVYMFGTNVMRRMDDKWRIFTFPAKTSRLGITAGAYSFPPNCVTLGVDLIFLYNRLLPFGAHIKGKYPVTITYISGVDDMGRAIEDEGPHDTEMTMSYVTVDLGNGVTAPAIRGRIILNRIENECVGFRQQVYYDASPQETLSLGEDSLKRAVDRLPLEKTDWFFRSMDDLPISKLQTLVAVIRPKEDIELPLLQVPEGFSSWTQTYDIQYAEVANILAALVQRTKDLQGDVIAMRLRLKDVTLLTNHLVEAVNRLEVSFAKLVKDLQDQASTPVWKKVLVTLASVAAVVSSIIMPFTAPLAIGLLIGSTTLQVGMMFYEGDYIGGGIQLAGVLVGVGAGYYTFRKSKSADYPVTNLKEANVIEPDYPTDFDRNLLRENGLVLEVKPLQMLGKTTEKIGESLTKNHKGILRGLLKLETAPVHARVRTRSTEVIDGEVYRTTNITGVTDGMPYLSHVSPRPGTMEIREKAVGGKFVNGWNETNVPLGGGFEDLSKSIQGLLFEGIATNGEYQSLIARWKNFSPQDRALSLNDAQDFVKLHQQKYTALESTRVPLNFDPTLVRNVTDVFAKHTGLYELTGLSYQKGPNNCQTYANEVRTFFAKGGLRSSKLENTGFLNDLMDAFDGSTQFKHIYGPVLQKRARVPADVEIPSVL